MREFTLVLATAAAIGFSSTAFAQTTTGPSGQTYMGGSKAVNGKEINRGPNTRTYGTGAHQGREQPEKKLDTGSEFWQAVMHRIGIPRAAALAASPS